MCVCIYIVNSYLVSVTTTSKIIFRVYWYSYDEQHVHTHNLDDIFHIHMQSKANIPTQPKMHACSNVAIGIYRYPCNAKKNQYEHTNIYRYIRIHVQLYVLYIYSVTSYVYSNIAFGIYRYLYDAKKNK